LPAPVIENSIYPMELREFKMFRSLIHEHTGIWLRDGKQIMLASRLSRRLRHHRMTGFAQYYDYVQKTPENSDEIRELINCVTTNKTSFFRERHHFDYLTTTVVPQIKTAAQHGGEKAIRIWSAACSTGEEPYSIAITLLEALNTAQDNRSPVPPRPARIPAGLKAFHPSSGGWKIEIVASDIDTVVLGKAARAVYPQESLESVPSPLQSKYFLRGKDDMAGFLKVKPEVARLVEFKRINLKDARWPLESLFDVIFFRNALIYFNQPTQDVFLRNMARYLKPKGYLFLGNSEHIPWLSDLLAPLNQTMYRLRSGE